MDLKPLRYHPLRYDLLRDSSDEVLEAFWDDGLTEEEVEEIGGPDALPIIIEQEEILAYALRDFDAAGQHIYHLEPKLIEMFRRTSVDEVPIGSPPPSRPSSSISAPRRRSDILSTLA